MGKAIVDMAEAYLVSLLGTGAACVGYTIVKDGIPLDARILDVHFNPLGFPRLEILMESAQWPEMIEGEPLPHLTPVMQVRQL